MLAKTYQKNKFEPENLQIDSLASELKTIEQNNPSSNNEQIKILVKTSEIL